MPNMDYGLFLDQEVYFLCATRNGDHGQWETVKAQSPIKAAKKFYDMLWPFYETRNIDFIFVLRPGENPGVDEPIKFTVASVINFE